MTPAEDEKRWSDARSLLDGMPAESAEQRLRRRRLLRLSLVSGLIGLGCALITVVLLLLDDGHTASDPVEDPASWQRIVGLSINGVGLVVLGLGAVAQWRANGRRMAWRSPLIALTRGQRKHLLATVRGAVPVDPTRLPLARYLAERLANQRSVVVPLFGMLMVFSGQMVVGPTPWWIGLVVVGALVLGVLWLFILREERRARRFLDEHPAADTSVS